MARILITGGAGFIGSPVAEAFLAAGHESAVVDNLATGRRENLDLDSGHAHTVARFAGRRGGR